MKVQTTEIIFSNQKIRHMGVRKLTYQTYKLYCSIKIKHLRKRDLYYHPVDSHQQHRLTADVSHLISVLPGFPGPS
jgi:hypothetical protein